MGALGDDRERPNGSGRFARERWGPDEQPEGEDAGDEEAEEGSAEGYSRRSCVNRVEALGAISLGAGGGRSVTVGRAIEVATPGATFDRLLVAGVAFHNSRPGRLGFAASAAARLL